ncbi:Protein tapetum determinant 1 [Rhynchospora pubera]|uniref:Protein tapetum determinant 1 n=1 Tax=Rhynchospora pubera TaxID=906938 RepID=A0AAV8FT15_9POAL|nr:Protein tapetum determinant 1 [Rhynchospora pubera]
MCLYKRSGSCSVWLAQALYLVFVLSFIIHGIVAEVIESPTQQVTSRKLIASNGADGNSIKEKSIKRTARIGIDTCSKDDVVIYQGATTPLPSGIPTYTVQILNTCMSGCAVSDIHLSCGWFSSARLINPTVFRRLRYDDCLVNDGGPLGSGQSISFEYANTYQYPLDVSSVVCN